MVEEANFLAVRRLRDVNQAHLIQRAPSDDAAVVQRVSEILGQIRSGGDAALRQLTLQLDGAELANPWLSDSAWDAAAATVPRPLLAALRANHRRIKAFHKLQVPRATRTTLEPGLVLGRRPQPLDSVACYVPGGKASYPSTVLMTVTPARLAGVPRIVVVTPPRRDGSVDPVVLAAARVAGATHVLRAGGAQAIAALALGTATIAPVQAIVGPGNAYVTAAKQAVAHLVRTDARAGPSELLILADATANPGDAALDLLAQAEHDEAAQVILVSTSKAVAQQVRTAILARLPSIPRRATVESSLRSHAALLVADGLAQALKFTNAYAPEHLAIMCKDPQAVLRQVSAAGSVFLGPHAPVSLGDYGSGTNHVLPTMGDARLRGGLAVEDFVRWITWQQASRGALRRVANDITQVATAEGLGNHAAAVSERSSMGGAA